jgi:hypothetical protein
MGWGMVEKRKSRHASFLDNYRIDDQLLLKPDRKVGKPGIYSGFDDVGDPVLVKFWPKVPGAPDEDLREIWHHEVRQLHRLAGYPGAERSIAALHQTAIDTSAFYLVLRPGQRRPLAKYLERLPPGSWLANPRLASNRARLWRNLLRIADGLEILHSQGLLHRNLDEWSVLTALGDEPDFQLTGFEWSLRLVGATAKAKSKAKTSPIFPSQPASFLADWSAFGRLAAKLLGLAEARLSNLGIPASDVSEAVSVEETRLIRNLIHAEPLERLDGEVVASKVDQILQDLGAEISGRDPKFHLVLQLGSGSLAEQIAEASEQLVGVGETDLQLRFVADDLQERCLLLAIRNSVGDGFRLALQGGKLLYTLTAYSWPRGQAGPGWEFAFCDRAERSNPAGYNLLGSKEIAPEGIELLLPREAADSFPRLRGKLSSWEELRAGFEAKTQAVSKQKRFHQALGLTLHLEALFAAADIYPVDVMDASGALSDGGHRLHIRLRSDPEREALSDALGLAPPSARLAEVLADDRRTDEWILTDARVLGQRDPQQTRWRYEEMRRPTGQAELFMFLGEQPAPSLNNPVLIPGDSVGRDAQFRRRLKALRALADHDELLRMLTSPRNRIFDTHDAVIRDTAFNELDESKQAAFEAIVGTLPMFMVQGPPGVGKTRLVRDLVASGFRADNTGRVLLTAQSNAAVDHLMDELEVGLQNEEQGLLIVRCRPRDDTDDAGPFEVGPQVRSILAKLASSKLVQSARPSLQAHVAALAEQAGGPSSDGAQPAGERYALQAFESLVVKSANVVFTTTNSLELERLIEERGQFDWAIVEEAGKATGGELLSPLLLSHRRLMIGDHKQLSPFNADRIVKLLEAPEKVRAALATGQEFIGKALRDPSTDELLDELEESDSDLPQLCSLARGCLLLFEQLIEAEFKLQDQKPTAKPIARRLTQQHRMHPSIARIVSHAFYDDALESHAKTVSRFRDEVCPVLSSDPKRLPEAPIVIVDMPWVQTAMGKQRMESFPRWHNREECEAIEAAVRLLRVRPGTEKAPSLAILSPYGEQVRRLRSLIDDRIDQYPELKAFRPAVGPGQYCGTVDSFQGNEADVVLVSLVRNNHHGGARSALGFLSDPRRMNVLLSRARWRTIVVGSLEFLEKVLQSAGPSIDGPDISFIARLLEGLEGERKSGQALTVGPSQLLGGRS